MENQAEYKGWAKVEVMGHQSHIGYVSTEAYGAAVLFRIDRPAIPEIAVEPISVLVGAGSIYRIIPCSEEVAIAAIQKEQRRRKKRLDKSRSSRNTEERTHSGLGGPSNEPRGTGLPTGSAG